MFRIGSEAGVEAGGRLHAALAPAWISPGPAKIIAGTKDELSNRLDQEDQLELLQAVLHWTYYITPLTSEALMLTMLKLQLLQGRRVRRKIAVMMLCPIFLSLLFLKESKAQVLNDAVNGLLENNCIGLLQGAGSAVLGPNLAAACTGATGVTGTGVSAGGGAASVQASAVSLLNRNVLRRLEELREESSERSGNESAMLLNPFGILAPGLFRGVNVASPSSASGGTSSAAVDMASHSRWRGLGFFASGRVEALNRDVTTFQDGYLSTILGVTAGADYRFTNRLVAGSAVSYSNTHGDFTNGGDFNTNSIGVTLFGSYLPTERTFFQVSGGYTNNNYLVSRVANAFVPGLAGGADRFLTGTPSSSTKGDVFSVNALGGYDHPIGMFTFGPRVGFNYTNTHIHDYTETAGGGLGLNYNDQWVNSVQSVVGLLGQAAFSTGMGVLVPQINADYIHEFANSQRFITVNFVEDFRANPLKFNFQNEVPVRNWFNLGTGLIMVLPNGWQPFVNFRAMVGNEQFNNYAGTFGLRMEL